MNADGGERLLLVDLAGITPAGTRRQIDSVAWSLDGTMIAFGVSPDPSENADTSIDGIWVVHADDSGLRHLATGGADDRALAWSPDGERIGFTSYGNDGRPDIRTSRIDGSDLRQLTASDEFEFDISWSPDGSKLAFVSGWGPSTFEIWVMDADGANKTQLTEGSGSYYHPAGYPDGTTLAFSSRSGSTGDIWIMNADGSGKTRLTSTSASRASTWFTCSRRLICYKEPQWSPDGTKLLFLNGLTKENDESRRVVRRGHSGYDRLWVLEVNLDNGLN
jgi:Tol biopolymer transport system component